MNIKDELFQLQDLKYREFHKKLIPDVDESAFIGVRVPELRRLAKRIYNENVELNDIHYYEEKMLYGFLIGLKNVSIEEHKEDISKFVKLIDNWAVCDCCCSSLKFVGKNKSQYLDFILSFINNDDYTARFSIVMLIFYYLDKDYIDRVIAILSNLKSDKHYVNMAIAWTFSTAFVKYENKITSLLNQRVLNKDVQNNTIQKICDSYRVDKNKKIEMRKLKY